MLTIVLMVFAGVMLLVLLCVGALVGWVAWQKHRFAALKDTHDLSDTVGKMAGNYLKSRPRGALVIGVVQRGETSIRGFGQVSATNLGPPHATTVFEIGSVTKALTGIALARMVADGQVKLTDTLRELLPPEVKLPAPVERITLAQLATHSSGLPRLPANLDLSPKHEANPYANYKAADLYAWLATAKLANPPGKTSDYSNVGFALLGHILELKAGKPYEQLMHDALCSPLGLSDTVIRLSPEQSARLAPGHSPNGDLTPNWDFDVMAPTGGYRSTAADMMTFIKASLAPADSPAGRALAEAQRAHFSRFGSTMGLGWHREMLVQGDLAVVWKNGGTGGYFSFVGFIPGHRVGVVLLSNYGDAFAGDFSLDSMGMEILKLATKVSLK